MVYDINEKIDIYGPMHSVIVSQNLVIYLINASKNTTTEYMTSIFRRDSFIQWAAEEVSEDNPSCKKLQLPTISQPASLALVKGNLDGPTWRNVGGETTIFYMIISSKVLDNMSMYKEIGQKLYVKYSCIKRQGNSSNSSG